MMPAKHCYLSFARHSEADLSSSSIDNVVLGGACASIWEPCRPTDRTLNCQEAAMASAATAIVQELLYGYFSCLSVTVLFYVNNLQILYIIIRLQQHGPGVLDVA